jgi:tetratricopeptide (TPR) repeat protein
LFVMSRRRRTGSGAPARGPASTPAPNLLVWYAAVFGVAFAVRAAVAIGLSHLPLAQTPELDSSQYLAWAGWIADGNHAWPQPTIQGPGYPYVLAALLSVSGGSLATVALLQAALGAIACVLTVALGSHWFGRNAGVAAGLLQAVQGPLAFVETSIYCEGLLILLTLLSMYVFVTRRSTPSGLVIAGLLLGAAATTRATALVLVPAFASVLMLESRAWPLRLRRTALITAATAGLVLIVAGKNARDPSGSFQVQGFAGLNYYIGNSPSGSGTAAYRLGAGWEQLWGEAWRAGVLNPAAQDRYYIRKTLGEIVRDPGQYVRVLGAKVVWSFQSDEIRDSLSLHFFAEAVRMLRWLPGFGLLFALAAAGTVVLIQRRSAPWELIMWLAGAWASVVLLVVGLRYRLPLVPPLAILGGLGVAALIDAARALRTSAPRAPAWRTLALLGGIAAAAAMLSQVWRHAPSHALSEEWAMTGSALNGQRRLADAEAAYRRAIALDDRSALAWKGLGIVLYNSNRLDEAREAHRHALAIDPAFADAHLRLAFVEGRLGRLHEALGHVSQAAAILPYDLAIRRALGQHLFATGDYGSAIRELEWVLTKTPADGQIARMLAEARRRQSRGPATPRSTP